MEPIWQVEPIFPTTLVDIVEQEREQEALIELDDYDDCIEEKESADGQATCLCDEIIKSRGLDVHNV